MAALAFPFAATPLALLGRPDVNRTAATIYDVLSSFRNRRTGLCNPKRETLAQRLGVSIRTVSRGIEQLRSAGFLRTQKLPGCNAYELTTPDQWQASKAAAECRDKSGSTAGTKLAGPPGQICPDQASASLYEPDGVQPEAAVAAAASVRAPGVAAAAATVGGCNEPTPAEQLVAELMPQHPEPGNAPRAIAAAGKILAARPEAATAIRQNHALWRERWATYGPGRFIPQLWRWIAEGDWEHPPAERKGAKSETWLERRERERKESDDAYYRMLAEHGMWDALREYMGPDAVEAWREKIKAEAA